MCYLCLFFFFTPLHIEHIGFLSEWTSRSVRCIYLWWPLLLCGTGSAGTTAAQTAGTYSPRRPEQPAEAQHWLELDRSDPAVAALVSGQDSAHSHHACSHRHTLGSHKEKEIQQHLEYNRLFHPYHQLELSTWQHVHIQASNSPVQTTFAPLLWLLSAETWLELSLVSGGGAVTDDDPRDCNTRGFFWSKKQTNPISLLFVTYKGCWLMIYQKLYLNFSLLPTNCTVAHTAAWKAKPVSPVHFFFNHA